MGRISIGNNPTSNMCDDIEKQTQPLPDDPALKLSVDAAHAHESLSLEQYRALVGMPQEDAASALQTQGLNGFVKTQHGLISLSNLSQQGNLHRPTQIRPATVTNDGFPSYTGSRLMIASHLFSRPSATRGKSIFSRRTKKPNVVAEYATSLYYTLLRLESDQHRLAHFYSVVTYICLIGQLAIASVLIILGALLTGRSDSDHRVAIAILAAVTGVLTGLLSLLKGQGYPTRMVQFAERLRQVRDKLEFMERALRANCGAIVTFQDVLDLWNEFEKVRNEQAMNRPDVWTTWNQLSQPLEPLLKVSQQQQQQYLNQSQNQNQNQKHTGVLPTLAGGKAHASAPEALAAAAAPSSLQRQNTAPAAQQHPPATPNTAANNTPTRGNTIRISNGGTNKETNA